MIKRPSLAQEKNMEKQRKTINHIECPCLSLVFPRLSCVFFFLSCSAVSPSFLSCSYVFPGFPSFSHVFLCFLSCSQDVLGLSKAFRKESYAFCWFSSVFVVCPRFLLGVLMFLAGFLSFSLFVLGFRQAFLCFSQVFLSCSLGFHRFYRLSLVFARCSLVFL